jgi:hypothetical protein
MPLPFKTGARVRQVAPVIEGEVVGIALVEGDVQYRVAYTGADGEAHERFFTEAEIVEIPAQGGAA